MMKNDRDDGDDRIISLLRVSRECRARVIMIVKHQVQESAEVKNCETSQFEKPNVTTREGFAFNDSCDDVRDFS